MVKSTTARPCVLIVEDNPTTLSLLRFMLEDAFDIVATPDFDEAIRLFQTNDVSVALLDIDLGETRSGVELLRRLRAMTDGTVLPAVACTAYALTGNREKLLAAGFNEYVAKPFTKSRLLAALENALAEPTPRPGAAQAGSHATSGIRPPR